MSQIASFYTLPSEKTDALLEAAVPQKRESLKRSLIRKRRVEETFDGFWEFLAGCARQQDEYAYSADGFLDLDLILAEKARMVFSFGNSALSQQLSDIRSASIAVFDRASAQDALTAIGSTMLSEDEVRKYYQENYPPEYEEPGTKAVLAAFECVKKWLSTVQSNEIGLLIIG